uniref:Tissue factor n=1 Tax=Callorhinchus milii TaxID=7868 RepID=A0A4W3I418_CALMI
MEIALGSLRLPKPENVFVNSTNMKHMLQWNPISPDGHINGSISYSVQFQGEFERIHLENTWRKIFECTNITVNQCNVTVDIASDVEYDLKVQAHLGIMTSEWAFINKLFSRQDTILTTPTLTVKVSENQLRVKVAEVEKNIEAHIYYWKDIADPQVNNVTIDQTKNPYNLDIEKGVTYCFQAQTYIFKYNKSSPRSKPVCKLVKNPTPYEILITVTIVLLLGTAIIMVFLVLTWKRCQWIKSSLFPKISIPSVSSFDDFPPNGMKRVDKSNEDYDLVQVFTQSELLLNGYPARDSMPVQTGPLKIEEKTNHSTGQDSRSSNCVVSGNASQWPDSMEILCCKAYQSQAVSI